MTKLLDKLINKINLDQYKYSPKIESINKDNQVFISDNLNSINLFKLVNNKLIFINKISFENKITSVSFNKEYNIMLVGLKDFSIRAYKLKNNRFYRIFTKKVKDKIKLIKVNENNRYFLALSNSKLYLIDLESGYIFLKISLKDLKLKDKDSIFCNFLDFTKENQIVSLLSSGNLIYISLDKYFIKTSQDIIDFYNIESAVLSPNKKILAVFSKENSICLYDLVEKKIIKEFKSPGKIIDLWFSPSGTKFTYIAGLCTDGRLFLFDIYTNHFIFIIKIKKRYIKSCMIYNNGSNLICSLSNGVIQKIDIKDLRDFILNNNYFFEHILLLLSIFNKENFFLNFEKDHIKDLFSTLPDALKSNFCRF